MVCYSFRSSHLKYFSSSQIIFLSFSVCSFHFPEIETFRSDKKNQIKIYSASFRQILQSKENFVTSPFEQKTNVLRVLQIIRSKYNCSQVVETNAKKEMKRIKREQDQTEDTQIEIQFNKINTMKKRKQDAFFLDGFSKRTSCRMQNGNLSNKFAMF